MNKKIIFILAVMAACSGCASQKIKKSQETIDQAATGRSFGERKDKKDDKGITYPAGVQTKDNHIVIKSRGKSFLSVLDEVARIKRFNYTLLTDISKFYIDYYDYENTRSAIESKTSSDNQAETLWNSYVPQQFDSVDDFVAQSILLIKKSFGQTEDKSLKESANNLAYRWVGDGFEFYNKQVDRSQADTNFSPYKKIFLYNLTEKEVAFYISRLMDIPYAPYSPNKPTSLPQKKSTGISGGLSSSEISTSEEKLPTKEEWRLQQQQQAEPASQLTIPAEMTLEVWKSQSIKNKVRWVTIPQQNAIIIKAEPDILREISQLLYAIDSEYKQIIIEAKVFEYDAVTAQKIGMALEDVAGSLDIKQPVGVGNVSVAQIFGPSVANALPLTFSQLGRTEQKLTLLSAISAYAQDGVVRISSEPRLILKPGQISTVDITTTKIIQPNISTQQIAGAATLVPVDVEVGVFFTVKPTLLSDNKIQLDMYLKQSEFVPTKEQNVLLSTTQNQMTTSVVANDGEWISLGGMISNKQTLVNTGVPFMKDIPGIGMLFGNDNGAGSTVIVEFMVRPVVKNLEDESRVPIHRVNFIEDRLKQFNDGSFNKKQ